jgi:hypothetical protein
MRRSSHCSLTRMLREAQEVCAESDVTGMPLDEVTASRAECARRQSFSRRQFLQSASGSLARSELGARVRLSMGRTSHRVKTAAFHKCANSCSNRYLVSLSQDATGV